MKRLILLKTALGRLCSMRAAKQRLASPSSLPSLAVTVRVLPATWAVAAVELLLAL